MESVSKGISINRSKSTIQRFARLKFMGEGFEAYSRQAALSQHQIRRQFRRLLS
jgi:hypothetical protein